MKKSIIVLLITVCAVFTAKAQTPYDYSIGGVIGFMNGVTFKAAPGKHVALQIDLGFRLANFGYRSQTFCLNPNLMYEGKINQNWNWFVGGGLSFGVARHRVAVYAQNDIYYDSWRFHTDFVFGLNAIGGCEYTFSKIPLTLQADIRPGYILYSNHNFHATRDIFDYNFLNISARYSF